MNVRQLKSKRVAAGMRQIDLAKYLNISEKTMNHKECSSKNRFTPPEMVKLIAALNLSAEEFNSIFFDSNLPFV